MPCSPLPTQIPPNARLVPEISTGVMRASAQHLRLSLTATKLREVIVDFCMLSFVTRPLCRVWCPNHQKLHIIPKLKIEGQRKNDTRDVTRENSAGKSHLSPAAPRDPEPLTTECGKHVAQETTAVIRGGILASARVVGQRRATTHSSTCTNNDNVSDYGERKYRPRDASTLHITRSRCW